MSFATLLFWLIAVFMLASLLTSFARKFQVIALLVLLGLGFIPLGPLNLMQHWQSLVGHLSLLSLFWFAHKLVPAQSSDWQSQRYSLLACSVALLLFYVLALGLSKFDPYRLGFSSASTLIASAFIVTLYTIYRRAWWLSCALISASAAYAFGLLPSTNVWDYFIDPILLMAVIVQTIKVFVVTLRKSQAGLA